MEQKIELGWIEINSAYVDWVPELRRLLRQAVITVGLRARDQGDDDQLGWLLQDLISCLHDADELDDFLGDLVGRFDKESQARLEQNRKGTELRRRGLSEELEEPVTDEEADEARGRLVDMGIKGGFTPEAIASWSSGALIPELKRRGLLPEFDLSDLTGEAAQ